jgi:uncharacterized membrane protein YhiD involved in acid resistance
VDTVWRQLGFDVPDALEFARVAIIWMTAAIGMAVGTGRVWLPVLGVAIAVLILALLGYYRIPVRRE